MSEVNDNETSKQSITFKGTKLRTYDDGFRQGRLRIHQGSQDVTRLFMENLQLFFIKGDDEIIFKNLVLPENIS